MFRRMCVVWKDPIWVFFRLFKKIKKLFDRRLLRKWARLNKIDSRNCTSISDNGEYPMFCKAASVNRSFFSNFRRNSIYMVVLEHLSPRQGNQYLREIEKKDDKVHFSLEDWKNFHKNDLIGNPYKYHYCIYGKSVRLSSTTIRYVKVLQDIFYYFQTENVNVITEIGVGYGGQARIVLSKMDNVKRYRLIDIPEVLSLVKKYLSYFKEEKKVEYCNGTKIAEKLHSDLVISNYAFSELVREVQDIYMKYVILPSKAGYITWNSLSYDQFDGYSVEELLQKIPGSKKLAEEPITDQGNVLIVWGHTSDVLF